jgi:hypothetical protein
MFTTLQTLQLLERSVGGTLAADPIQSVPTEARTALSGVNRLFHRQWRRCDAWHGVTGIG